MRRSVAYRARMRTSQFARSYSLLSGLPQLGILGVNELFKYPLHLSQVISNICIGHSFHEDTHQGNLKSDELIRWLSR